MRDRYNELAREDRRAAELAGREPRFVRIDASAPAQEVGEQIVGLVLRRLRRDSATAGA